MEKKNIQVAKISVFITSIFVIFLSITYAFINMTVFGTKRQVITAGSLELELEEENAITLENAMPMYDEVGMLQDAFTFRLINKTSANINYILKLVDITTGEKLDTSIVKYGLTKDGENKIKYLSNIVNGRIDKGVINGNQTIEYSLRLWIDSGVEDDATIHGKSLSYRIDVVAEQDIEISYMKARGVYFVSSHQEYIPAIDRFYAYGNKITNVVFENQVAVPNEIPNDMKWDESEKQDGSVMTYLEENGTLESGDTAYRLHIQSEGGVHANPDSSNLFYEFGNLISIDGLENFDTSNVTNMFGMFSSCNSLAISSFDFSKIDTSSVTNMSSMFVNYNGSEPLNLTGLDTSNVENMSHMFGYYRSSQPLDLTPLNTSKVTNMSRMFSDYSSSQPLNLTALNTSNVTNMESMFAYYDGSEPLNLTGLDTSNVENMSRMFSYYKNNQPLDLTPLNTSNVTNMSYMFSNWDGPYSPFDFTSLDTSKVTDMSYMFSNWKVKKFEDLYHLVVKGLNTSRVTNMSGMFSSSVGWYHINISGFDTKNVTNFSNFVQKSQNLSIDSYDISTIENIDALLSALNDMSSVSLKLWVKNEEVKNWISARYSNFSYNVM